MKKLKVFAILSLAGVLALPGCGSSTPPKETGATTEAATPEKVTWFADVNYWNPPSPWSTDPNTVEGAITQKTGLTFDFNIPAQDAGMKISLMLATSEELPDLITLTDDKLEKKLIDSGMVWNMEEFLKKYDSDSTLLANFPADVKQAMIEKDGAWYSFGSHMDTPDARKLYPPSTEVFTDRAKYRINNAVMFNEQLMKQIGVTVKDLKTEDGVLAAFEKVKKLKGGGAPVIPLQIGGKMYQLDTIPALQEHFGAMGVDKDGNYRDVIFAPETKHALKFMFNAARRGYFDPSQMTFDDGAISAAATSGRVFCFIGNTAKAVGKPGANTWVSPGVVRSNQNTQPVQAHYMKAGKGWMQTYVSKTAAHPERIAKWLDFMTSDEGMILHTYGFEGKDYNLKGGLVIKTEQGVKEANDYAKTGVFAFWPFHNIAFFEHVLPAPTEAAGNDGKMAIQVQTAAGKESTIYDVSLFPDPADVIPTGSKMDMDQAQIRKYKEAQISKIILAKDKAKFDKFYDEMIGKIKQLGQTEIDAKINEKFQKQEQERGETIKGINS
jgi:putative aldouronate transport system substrate-binding protein